MILINSKFLNKIVNVVSNNFRGKNTFLFPSPSTLAELGHIYTVRSKPTYHETKDSNMSLEILQPSLEDGSKINIIP